MIDATIWSTCSIAVASASSWVCACSVRSAVVFDRWAACATRDDRSRIAVDISSAAAATVWTLADACSDAEATAVHSRSTSSTALDTCEAVAWKAVAEAPT
ncbi:hypothetical protein TSO352_29915 [Azospirillum sp. TSO35-2]|nr:hypothetical protein TSO352_29915 [Azospirillum sp. TSO35-2]